jgi:hypothetical protein
MVFAVPSAVLLTSEQHSGNQIGRNAATCNPAGCHEHREADTPVNSTAEDESRQAETPGR